MTDFKRLTYDSLLNSLPKYTTEPVVTWTNRNKKVIKVKLARKNVSDSNILIISNAIISQQQKVKKILIDKTDCVIKKKKKTRKQKKN